MMRRCVNQITIVGTMDAAPIEKVLPDGQKLVEFKIATRREWTRSSDSERQERVELHRCVAWNGTGPKFADIVKSIGRAGLNVYVQGRLEYRAARHPSGLTDVWIAEIVVKEFLALDRPPSTPATTS